MIKIIVDVAATIHISKGVVEHLKENSLHETLSFAKQWGGGLNVFGSWPPMNN